MSYSRVPGLGRRLFEVHKLWFGNSHLLLLRESLTHQHYRRFNYADITGVQVHRVSGSARWQVVLPIVLIGICAILAVLLPGLGKVMAGVFGLFLLVLLSAEVLRGPRCHVWLTTALGVVELTPLKRVKGAERFVSTLTQSVESNQGRLEPEQLSSALAATWSSYSNPAGWQSEDVIAT